MSVPTFADRVRALLESRVLSDDDESNQILDAFIEAFADAAMKLSVIAFGTDDIPPGQALKDPSVAPDWALAHAAQYTGSVLPGRFLGEEYDVWLARARDEAVYPRGIKRGTEEAVRRAAALWMTGTKTVVVSYTTNPYEIVVRVAADEVPDVAALRFALSGDLVSGGRRGAIPADRRLILEVGDVVPFSEATLHFNVLPPTVTADNVTLGDVT